MWTNEKIGEKLPFQRVWLEKHTHIHTHAPALEEPGLKTWKYCCLKEKEKEKLQSQEGVVHTERFV